MKSKLKNGVTLLRSTIDYYMDRILTFNFEEDYASIYEMGRKAKDLTYQITDADILQILIDREILTLQGEMDKDVQDIILSALVYEDSPFPSYICDPVVSLGETTND